MCFNPKHAKLTVKHLFPMQHTKALSNYCKHVIIRYISMRTKLIVNAYVIKIQDRSIAYRKLLHCLNMLIFYYMKLSTCTQDVIFTILLSLSNINCLKRFIDKENQSLYLPMWVIYLTALAVILVWIFIKCGILWICYLWD